MASALVVETSVTNNSSSQDSNHPDDFVNQVMLLLGSNHFLKKKKHCLEIAREWRKMQDSQITLPPLITYPEIRPIPVMMPPEGTSSSPYIL